MAYRALRRPRWELRRVWTYSRLRGREAFLEYQRSYLKHQLPALRRMARVRGLGPRGRGSTVSRETNGPLGAGFRLGELLSHYGSDKASRHDYNVIYEALERHSGRPRVVFEVGIGTSAPRSSSMGSDGQPGASARAFRDWGSSVIACDIDKATLFEEEGIRTFYLDQLRPSTFRRSLDYAKSLGGIDLAIIDGLHTPEADLNSLLALAPYLTDTGVLVVEDVEPDPVITQYWGLLLANVPASFSAALVETRASWVVLLGPAAAWDVKSLVNLYSPR